jgi:hypothetical protein
VEVEDEHVGAVALDLLERGGDVAGLGHHLEAGLCVEEHAQAAPDDLMVVGDHDCDGLQVSHPTELSGLSQGLARSFHASPSGSATPLRSAASRPCGRRAASR